MKNLSLLLIIVAFSSCKKCATCTRQWHYTSYEISHGDYSVHWYPKSFSGEKEENYVCGSKEISGEEKTQTTHTEEKISNTMTLITDGTGECNCVTE